jgi:hypothetical protein
MKKQLRHLVLCGISLTGGLFSQAAPTPEEFRRIPADEVATVFEAATISERQDYAKAAVDSHRSDIIAALLNDRHGSALVWEEIEALPDSKWKDSLLLMTLEMVHGSDQTEGSFPPLGVPLQEPLVGLVRRYLPNTPPLQAREVFYRLSREKLGRDLRHAMGLPPRPRQQLTAKQLLAAKMNTYELALEYEADLAAENAKQINPPSLIAMTVDSASGASSMVGRRGNFLVCNRPVLAAHEASEVKRP